MSPYRGGAGIDLFYFFLLSLLFRAQRDSVPFLHSYDVRCKRPDKYMKVQLNFIAIAYARELSQPA